MSMLHRILCFNFVLYLVTAISHQFCQQYKQSMNDSPDKPDLFIKCLGSLIDHQQDSEIVQIQSLIPQILENKYLEILDREIKRLQTIEDYIIISQSTCRPVLKWAQNMTHVLITAKLSHRWDSPPCLKTVSEHYNMTNNTIFFENICYMNNVQINYIINQQLFNLTTSKMTIKKDGVGTYSITIEKIGESIWASLFSDGQNIPLWQQLMDKDQEIKKNYLKVREQFDKNRIKKHAKSDN